MWCNAKRYLSFFVILFVMGCDEKLSSDKPVVFTGYAPVISEHGVTFAGRVAGPIEGIVEYGFIWSENENPDTSKLKWYAEGRPSSDTFEKEIQSGICDAGNDYYYRAFVKLSNNSIVYGESLKFKSKGSTGPVITDFNPKSGYNETTVVLTGDNFNVEPSHNVVKFGDYFAEVLEASETQLTARLPANINFSGSVNVTVWICPNETSIAKDSFQLYGPVVNKYLPTSGPPGTSVTITGSNFSSIPSENSIYFGASMAVPDQATPTQLVVKVPPTAYRGSVMFSVKTNGEVSGEGQHFIITN